MPDVIPKSKASRRATSAGLLSGPASLAGQINTPRRSSVEVKALHNFRCFSRQIDEFKMYKSYSHN